MQTLNESKLYLGDNGRCFCGSLQCAGSSAHFTGRGTSGQKVMTVTPTIAIEAASIGVTLRCESCGKATS
jgi:hypothetical protein